MKRRLVLLGGCVILSMIQAPILPAAGVPKENTCTATLLDESAQPTLALHGKRIPLTADRSDPHHVIYSSENGDYQVEVWRADASPMEVSQEDFDALTAASLASISTQENDTVEEVIDFEDLPAPTDLTTIATRVTTPTSTE